MVCLTDSLFVNNHQLCEVPAARCLVSPKWVQEKKSVPNVQVGNVEKPGSPFQPRPAEPWCNKS